MSARVTQATVEILHDNDPNARFTQDGVEILFDCEPNARFTQGLIEILWTPEDLYPATRKYNQVAIMC